MSKIITTREIELTLNNEKIEIEWSKPTKKKEKKLSEAYREVRKAESETTSKEKLISKKIEKIEAKYKPMVEELNNLETDLEVGEIFGDTVQDEKLEEKIKTIKMQTNKAKVALDGLEDELVSLRIKRADMINSYFKEQLRSIVDEDSFEKIEKAIDKFPSHYLTFVKEIGEIIEAENKGKLEDSDSGANKMQSEKEV